MTGGTYKLYGRLGAGSLAPQILLEESGVPYELAWDGLSPYVLGERFSAANPYLHMLASWCPDNLSVLGARLPNLAQHAELLRRRPATRKVERDHNDS